MEKAASHIIKGDLVQLDGAFQLNSAPSLPQSVRNAHTPKPSTPAQAVVVEQNNEFAIVEVTCSCGKKIPVKCMYTNQTPPGGAN
jgi:hypothetical protein